MWKEIAEYQRLPLVELFGSDPDRVSRFTVEESGLLFDFSKTHLTPDLMAAFGRLADAQGLSTMRDRLFLGEIVNPPENRAADHGAERGSGQRGSVERASAPHSRSRGGIDALEAEGMAPLRPVRDLRIGQSPVGPGGAGPPGARHQGRQEVGRV